MRLFPRRRTAAVTPMVDRARAVRAHTSTPEFRAVAAAHGFTPDAPPFDQDTRDTALRELAAIARPITRGDDDLEALLAASGIPVADTHPGLTPEPLAPVTLLENRRREVARRNQHGGAL